MTAITHLLNIGALATWLSVAGFGTVGVVIHVGSREPVPTVTLSETVLLTEDDFLLGGEASPVDSVPEVETLAANTFAPLPAPPEPPAITPSAPLPAIPSLPLPAPKTAAAESTGQSTKTAVSGVRKSSGKNKSGAVSGSGVMSDAARLAAGHKPKPAYPFSARLKGQSGTVFVTFTIGEDGRVVSAHASKPCPFSILNNSAIAGIRQWRFPPGRVITRTQPITFTLE